MLPSKKIQAAPALLQTMMVEVWYVYVIGGDKRKVGKVGGLWDTEQWGLIYMDGVGYR